MVEKNDVVTAMVEGLANGGEGIVRHEGITFFVPACLPGEKVRFHSKGNIRLQGNTVRKVSP